MKILLIRHGEVAMKWEKRYTSEEYNEACERYDMADIDILPDLKPQDTGDYERIYVSTLKRSVQTRQQMFPYAPEEMVIQTPLLNEVPMKAFDSSAKIRPRWLYDLRGRVQWWIGGGQTESCAQTRARADALIDLLEEKNENAILITHGFFMGVLISRFKKRKRYEVYRGSTFVIRPLEKIKIIDKQPHCGGCHHNCLLKNAGCMIGQDKARREGIM